MIISILIILSLSILFFFDIQNITLNFVLENKSYIDGSVFFDDLYFRDTEAGKITIPKRALNVSKIEFIPSYLNQYYSIEFNLGGEDLNLRKIFFIVPMNKLGEGKSWIYFYDNLTNCQLNGDLYVDDSYIGSTNKGNFLLFRKDIINKSVFSIKGYTDDCFLENQNILFYRHWDLENLKDIFNYNKTDLILTSYNPRQPIEYFEMQSFVKPDYVVSFLDEIQNNFIWDYEKDLDYIAENVEIEYFEDKDIFNISEYWQFPNETLLNEKGDCEDWAIAILSLMRKYNNEIQCYNMLWQNHVSVFCYFDNNFIIYDQDKTKFKTHLFIENTQDISIIEENKIKIREMRDNYFKYYGLNNEERNLLSIFNEEKLFIFNESEDFVNWAITLINE